MTTEDHQATLHLTKLRRKTPLRSNCVCRYLFSLDCLERFSPESTSRPSSPLSWPPAPTCQKQCKCNNETSQSGMHFTMQTFLKLSIQLVKINKQIYFILCDIIWPHRYGMRRIVRFSSVLQPRKQQKPCQRITDLTCRAGSFAADKCTTQTDQNPSLLE